MQHMAWISSPVFIRVQTLSLCTSSNSAEQRSHLSRRRHFGVVENKKMKLQNVATKSRNAPITTDGQFTTVLEKRGAHFSFKTFLLCALLAECINRKPSLSGQIGSLSKLKWRSYYLWQGIIWNACGRCQRGVDNVLTYSVLCRQSENRERETFKRDFIQLHHSVTASGCNLIFDAHTYIWVENTLSQGQI